MAAAVGTALLALSVVTVVGAEQATMPACATAQTMACRISGDSRGAAGFRIVARHDCPAAIRYQYDYHSPRLREPIPMAGTIARGRSVEVCPAFGGQTYVLKGACIEGWPGCGLVRGPSERAVRHWLATALNADDAALQGRLSPVALRTAWERLKLCRDAGQSMNLDLAAAEHYAFARFIASQHGDTGMLDLPEYYEKVKHALSEYDLMQKLRQTDQPVSPPHSAVTRWGKNGVRDGLRDYEFATGKKPQTRHRDKLAMLSVAFGTYRSKAGTGAKCELDARAR